MNITVLDGYTENPGDISWEDFERLGCLTVYERTPPELIIKRAGGSEIILVNKTPISATIISACPTVKYIGVLATGYNVIDINAAKEHGIIVTNIPSYGTNSVAQMVFAHLLAACHHVEAHSEKVYNGQWTSCPDFCFWNYPLIELYGKTMGIIGFGRIGQATAKIASAFGMNVLAYDISPNKQGDSPVTFVTLNELLRHSDVISLHCPLLESTNGMINKESIAEMKNGVILINTSRGPLIVERDLAEALESGKIAFAGLDVVSREPIEKDNPLLKAKNCHITPHIAWAPKEARIRLMDIAVKNLEAFLSGKPVNVVNP